MFRIHDLLAVATLGIAVIYAGPTPARTIINEWSSVKTPPAPEPKPVTLDPKTTAILVMDFVKQTCNNDRRPRCVASIPKVEKLIAAARAQGAMLIFTTVPQVPIADTLPAVDPNGKNNVAVAAVDEIILWDKYNSHRKILIDKNSS